MRKKNKLYTANKWNQPLFAQGVDREHQNIFDGYNFSYLNNVNANSFGSLVAKNDTSFLSKKPSLKVSPPTSSGSNISGYLGAASALGNIGKSETYRNGLYDMADPVYHLAGGRESAVGNGMSDAGVSVFQAGAQSGNGYMMLAGAGLKVLGGLTNAAWGTKWNKKAISNIENNNANARYAGNSLMGASTTSDLINGSNNMVGSLNFNKSTIGKDGWFSRKVGGKYRGLQNQQAAAQAFQSNSLYTGAQKVDTKVDDMAMANTMAFGGPLEDSNSGAINYDFMNSYLTAKNKAVDVKNKVNSNIFGSLQAPPLSVFALGGDIQSNSSDFTTGLAHIDEGGSHEENPYDGVQVGISRENGNPNLVEEGETVFDDYVFSRRIKPDARTKKKFHLGGNLDTTFADLSKKLEKESLERPNDPLSRAALKKQMHSLAEEQERQKEERQTQEAQEAFAQLPPEQQQAIMEQVAMEEQQAEQAAQQQQLSVEQQEQLAQQQPDTQQIQETQMQEPQMEEVQTAACGGKLNKFDKGGDMKRQMYKALGLYTDADFDKWRAEKKLDEIKDWENITKNEAFMAELAKANPALSDAIAKGYDFGAFKPTASGNLTFDFKHGGWGLEDYNAWNGSTDAAWKEAVEKGLVKKGMNSEEIGKALSQTDAYKRGSNWLKADEGNRLAYLQQILNSQDAPQAARDYAAKYVDSNGWIKDAKRDYQTIFEDPNGTGVRNTHPGTYWKTPNEVLRESQAKNYEVAADGSIHEIIGDVPAEWKNVGSYKWQDAQTDYGNNYFTRPVTATTEGEKNKEEEEEGRKRPKYKSTWQRVAGAFGPAVGLAAQISGLGKPEWSDWQKALDVANGTMATADYKPIPNYLRYTPMDIWSEQNRLNANSGATNRAIANSSSPFGAKMSGMIANGYNNQLASADLYKKALEYNDAKRLQKANYDSEIDKVNAAAYNSTSATNAEIANNQRRFKTQLMTDFAKARMDANSQWYKGIYSNMGKLFDNFSNWGKENAQHNMIAGMVADQVFGPMKNQYMAEEYLEDEKKGKKNKSNIIKAAKGGKLKRKKGLTF